jgi:hypothetical protein
MSQPPLQFPEAVVALAKFLEPNVVLMTSAKFTVPRDGCYYFYNRARDSMTVIDPQRRTMGRPPINAEKEIRFFNKMPPPVL